ncbi:MAG: hypothetical protein JWQ72_3758 [Polaromonas sp.]|nr:hypothetical protein [Polaromonas sp.]
MQILNIAAYKFVPLQDLPGLKSSVTSAAEAAGLKGTILLADEGINLFLAGAPADTGRFLAWLRSDERFHDLQVKESWSHEPPFRKLLVKIKAEIIRMDHPAVQPAAGRAPAVDAATLKRWLDQGCDDQERPVVTLDTRNDFEVDTGTFRGAVDWRISKFTEFPAAFMAGRAALEGKTVVSFCTGGIRCEKAALFMREAGLANVYQLEGGILTYLETLGGPGEDGTVAPHFEGNCFVFDGRRAVDAALVPRPASAVGAPILLSPPFGPLSDNEAVLPMPS